ncbi:hypothetical protein SAMN05444359_10326 [Neolewinella agarilytica]|uniref:Uncharacterized protein n=1 Tax=Neolewinella agarilytica TaxID=478744 RepID=A0A1H9B8D1_9BACT|nr:hypothetical protein SAMN05444359_10326 [Neolewinella agarilytica]
MGHDPKAGLLYSWIKLNLDNLYVDSIRAFTTFFYFEAYFVAFANVVDQAVGVNENVFAAVIRGDETKSLGLIEELYCSFFHNGKI